MTEAEIRALTEKTADAYSFKYYGEASWRACVRMLANRGYRWYEIEVLLRSKWMRWAAERRPKRRYRATSADLVRLMDITNLTRGWHAEINDLVHAYFGMTPPGRDPIIEVIERKGKNARKRPNH